MDQSLQLGQYYVAHGWFVRVWLDHISLGSSALDHTYGNESIRTRDDRFIIYSRELHFNCYYTNMTFTAFILHSLKIRLVIAFHHKVGRRYKLVPIPGYNLLTESV